MSESAHIFRAIALNTTRGGRVAIAVDPSFAHGQTYVPPEWAREMAKQLSEAADEAEKMEPR